MLCTNAINTSNTIRTQTGAGLTQPLSKISVVRRQNGRRRYAPWLRGV